MDTSKIKEISQGIVEVKNAGNTVWKGDPFSDLPGPKKLIGGTMDAGFFGECSVGELISGDSLASMIGLSAGTSQYSNGGWLKFAYMGKVEFIAKKTFRYRITWDEIKAANAVFGNRTINIKGHIYKIRLMKGKTEGKQDDANTTTGSICHNSEWNSLMLPIHKNSPSNWKSPDNVESPTENWKVNYSDEDLITDMTNGCWSWCQEYGKPSTERLLRGGVEVSGSLSYDLSDSYSSFGWRPVLEFVK